VKKLEKTRIATSSAAPIVPANFTSLRTIVSLIVFRAHDSIVTVRRCHNRRAGSRTIHGSEAHH
jgi:hypothetical protein